MNENINEKLRLCLLKLLNINHLRFFGYIAYNLNFKIKNDKNISITEESNSQITLNKKRSSILTFNNKTNKFELIFYQSFLEDNPVEIILYNILHNILHILSQHNIRINERDREIYEIAADHIVNKQLYDAILSKTITEIKFPSNETIIDSLYSQNLTVEEVYEYLKKYIKKKDQETSQINDQNNDQNNSENNEIKATKYSINNQSITNIDDIQTKNNKNEIKQLNDLKSSANLLLGQPSIGKSLEDTSLFEYLQQITKIKIPWYKLLEKAILVNTKPNPDIRSWINPRKRFRVHNILLPGTGIDKDLETIVICIDTSGSITTKELEIFAGVVLDSLSQFDKVWLLKHDIKIRQNVIINKNEINKQEIIQHMEGRGGTSHKYVYDEIEKKVKEKSLQIGLVLFLTDFLSDIEEIYMNYTWTKQIPIIHIINNNSSILKRIPKELDDNPILIENIIDEHF